MAASAATAMAQASSATGLTCCHSVNGTTSAQASWMDMAMGVSRSTAWRCCARKTAACASVAS